MGKFMPVFSAVRRNILLTPPPEAILISVAECGRGMGSLKSTRTLIKKSQAEKVFLDNGMYTFFEKWRDGERVIFDDKRPVYPGKGIAMNITPNHGIYFSLAIKPDVTFVTDLPVPDLLSPPDPGEEEFHFMLTSYHNILRARQMTALHAQYCPDIELYYPFQGYTIDHFLRIKKELGKLQFDGYALATRVLNWSKVVGMMLMLRQQGVRKVHVFAGSSLPIMAVGAFFARHFFDEISYDSANWLNFSLVGTFRFFGSMTTVRPMPGLDISPNILSRRCDCLHCKGRSIGDIREIEWEERQVLLALHNYVAEVETAKALYDHSETPRMLRDFLLSKSQRIKLIKEIYECLSAVVSMKDHFADFNFVKGFADFIFSNFKAR